MFLKKKGKFIDKQGFSLPSSALISISKKRSTAVQSKTVK
jgi:hypothetical protein